MKHIFGILLISFSLNVSADNIQIGGAYDTYTLSPIKDGNKYFGLYQHYQFRLSGTKIYLFPDHTFAITNFCDICEEKVLTHGTYSFENSIITFNYIKSANFPHSLIVRHGRIGEKDNARGLTLLLTQKQLDKLKADKYSRDFIQQMYDYHDWVYLKNKFIQ